ncbi:MAG: S8 family peptidase [Bacteroidia bacterium]|nr:S8 family peptidase [Bacteroidia bacterium]
MKWSLTIVALLCIYKLSAQDFYYRADGSRLYLTPNPGAVTVHFEEAIAAGSLNLSTRSLHYVSGHELGEARFLTVELDREAVQTPAAAIRLLGLDPATVRSVSPGLMLEDGFPLWLSHQIVYKPGETFDEATFMAILGEYPGARTGATPTGIHTIELTDIAQVMPLANRLYETGMFVYCAPDFIAKAEGQSCHPSDSLYSVQYYLHNTGGSNSSYPYRRNADVDIDAPEAWCITTGSSSVVVAIIDEGVEDHEDLYDASNVTRVLPGWTASDPTNGDGSPLLAPDQHGVAIAGIIAASHNTIGVAGIAPNSMILPVHVFTDGSAPASHFADAINWAWQNGGQILNNSWVYSSCSENIFPAVDQAILDAYTYGRGGLGAITVFSAGQTSVSGANNCMAYPANSPYVISAGAVDPQNRQSTYSRYGSELDLVAPSSLSYTNPVNVTVLDRMGQLGTNYTSLGNSDYLNRNYSRWFGGTSVTAAQAAGVSALLLSLDPNLTYAEVYDLLTSTTDNVGPAGYDTIYGYGRLNAYNAVLQAQNTLPVVWSSFEGRLEEEAIHLDWTTATETQNDYFVVERLQAGNFMPLGQVDGAGSASTMQAYTFVDYTPLPGANVYRLRQVDFDGTSHYSTQVEVTYESRRYELITPPHPNPSQDAFTFNLMHDITDADWQLTDLQGRSIRRGTLSGANQYKIDTHDLPGGIYVLQVAAPGYQTVSHRIVVQH